MRITAVEAIAEYRMFIVDIIGEERAESNGSMPLHIVHGFYDAWRRRHGAQDSR